jgi:hypothetical protein
MRAYPTLPVDIQVEEQGAAIDMEDLPTGQFVSYPGVKFPSALNTSTCYPQRF